MADANSFFNKFKKNVEKLLKNAPTSKEQLVENSTSTESQTVEFHKKEKPKDPDSGFNGKNRPSDVEKKAATINSHSKKNSTKEESKKKAFADKFKEGGGFQGKVGIGGENFTKRFRPKKTEKSEDSGGAFSSIKSAKSDEKPFSGKKGIKKNTDDMSQAEKIRRKRSQNVFLVRGKDRGRPAWHYALIDNDKRELFLAATRKGSLDVADYGEILKSGWGQDPPESVVKQIEEEFNL